MPEILPRFNAAMERLEDMQKLGKILEAGEAPPDSNGRVYRRSARRPQPGSASRGAGYLEGRRGYVAGNRSPPRATRQRGSGRAASLVRRSSGRRTAHATRDAARA